MDLSGAFHRRIFTSDGNVIEPDDLAHDRTRYSYSNYFDLSGYSFQGHDAHEQVVDSQPAPAVEGEADTLEERREQFERLSDHLANLRINSRGPPHVDVEEEESEDEQSPEPNVRAVMDQIVQEQNQRRTSLITREALLYWSLHLSTLAWNAISWAAYYTKKAVVGAYEGVLDNQYYFFQSSTVPYLASRINLKAPGAAQVEWTYTKDTQVFAKRENDGRLHHLPYLTGGIWHQGLLLYVITDFIEECKYMGDEPPSPHHILSAWFLKTGILLDPTLPFVLKVFTEEGEEKELQLQPGQRE